MISALLLTFIVTKQLNVMQITEEIWKDVIGLDGMYQVSNKGKIKNTKTGKTLKPYLIQGYPTVDLKGRQSSVHRVVAIHFKDNPLNKPQVNHKDCDKTNNNDWNLEWVTGSENAIHAVQNGLLHPLLKGEQSYAAKLSDIEVIQIRQIGRRIPSRKLATIFNVTKSTILRVINRQIWTHI